MKIDLDQIERVAREATPGPWATRAERNCPRAIVIAGTEQIADAGEHTHWTDEQCAKNAAHIANCSPDVVLALVARIRELQRDNVNLEMQLRDAATDHESDCYESHKAGRREMADMWRGVHFNCPGCGRMLKNEPPR